MFQNLGFNDINIFEEVSFHINDILISSTEKDLYLYTLWQDALLEVLLTLSFKRNIFFIFYKIVSIQIIVFRTKQDWICSCGEICYLSELRKNMLEIYTCLINVLECYYKIIKIIRIVALDLPQ